MSVVTMVSTNEWMFDDDPKFQALADALAAFYKENLKAFQFGLQK